MLKPSDCTLLIVDDNEDNRYTLTQRLTRSGYSHLITANDGRRALELLRSQHFDLVLLDIMMPEMNGYEVLEQMKADEHLREVPVVMISAVDQVDSVIRCIELGAEDYLPKPFNPTLLRARIGASLEKKQLRDAVRASLHRLEHELDAARVLQLGMLPRDFPEWSSARPVCVHALMEPAREVGGDLYDFFFAGNDRFCFLVGDVSGKGAPAAMFMARTRSLVRMTVDLLQNLGVASSPQSVVHAVNRELCRDNREHMFVTLFLGFLHLKTGAVAYLNAGHPPPYVLHAASGVDLISQKPQPPLGVRADTVYESYSLTLEPHDALFICTDGIAEATNAENQFYTAARLKEILGSLREAAPKDIIGRVKEDVDRFTGASPKADDVTMLAVRWKPSTG